MNDEKLLPVVEQQRHPSPTKTPQALAWHDGALWMGSRDLRRFYGVDPTTWTVFEEREAPGIPWAAVSTGKDLRLTIGEGTDDDRYLHRYVPGDGFTSDPHIPCPEFTGSYLSFDGRNLHLSQWYKQRILKLDEGGNILNAYAVGAEICGHTFVDGVIYVLRGTEAGDEDWRIGRFDPRVENAVVEDLATVPLQCRSLAFDGERFWSNHRAADETVSFSLPK